MAYNIVTALKLVVRAADHEVLADATKVASRETKPTQSKQIQDYLDDMQAEWYDNEEDEGSMSLLLAELGKSQGTLNTNALTASSVTLNSEWRNPA